ncbi:class I SAM-dependent methyltransferase [Verminephrobacter eiseniae]|uniref:class I SAM-dependent methyltransferase n=1 Tax=Verminephrobacter eiseniae TaxID=364317 RepID=UPI0022389B79|nr:class I SAM-dependent methyltransferase [Verminephrobacter eiseniae]MCW5236568.1 methyltransferase domain-containing protein [Verminephrobacter eiseniae]
MENYLLEYLQSVGIVDNVVAARLPCEVCGSTDHKTLVDQVEIGTDRFGRLPVVGCANCGFVYQSPRFNKEFYDTYYDKYYRMMLFGDNQPEKGFLLDQVRRGEHLRRSIARYLPEKGRLLDVGCSAGGLMVSFAKHGWEVLGTDPDSGYVNFGKNRLGLRIEAMSAEDMVLPDAHYDLIIITGSLEHVFDVNRVLQLCRKACAPGGLLYIEGRALNYGILKGFFSHNHRRYLTLHSIELLMLRHGWSTVLSTEDPLCGPSRPGGVHVLGRASQPLDAQALQREIESGRRDRLDELARKLAVLKGVA